jgi:ribosomal protein L20
LQKANIDIDRKMLAELAVNQPEIFTEVARRVKEALAG